jgi:hypothetical protein
MTAFDWVRFTSITDRIAGEFSRRTDAMAEHVDASILFSDGLCVCALCELFEVDQLIEVGTGYGGSTEMFGRYFAGHSRLRHIWSIDDAVNPRWQWLLAVTHLRRYSRHVWSTEKRAKEVARARLAAFSNVTLLRGDGFAKLPPLVRRLAGEGQRIGLLIDGPKGELQLRLAEQAFALSPLVTFAALDDIGPMYDAERRHAQFMASGGAVFATSDARYFDRYGSINRGRLPGRMLKNPAHRGYGLGVMVNADRAAAAESGAA